MALKAYLDFISKLPFPQVPPNDSRGLLDSSSTQMAQREEHLLPYVGTQQLNPSLSSHVVDSRIPINPSNLGAGEGSDAAGEGSDAPEVNLRLSQALQLHNANMGTCLNNLSSPHPQFSSNNLGNAIGSSSPVRTLSQFCQTSQVGKRQLEQIAGSNTLFESNLQNHEVLVPMGQNQAPDLHTQMLKKPRIATQEDAKQQHIIQQLLQMQNKVALTQHQRQQNQLQQLLVNSILQQGVQAERLKYLLQHKENYEVPFKDSGLCSQRFLQYLCHLRRQPQDKSIDYWRGFVSEYYAPGSKKRWCLSVHENIGKQAAGAFSLSSTGTWCCDVCGSTSGKGLEVTHEIFPRLFKIKFECGVFDEIWRLQLPREYKFPSGLMMLEYGKAVQESVYENFRTSHEGELRVIFRQDMKMLSWEFCVRQHDELLNRQLIAPLVNQLIQTARIYQRNACEYLCARIPLEYLQSSFNVFVAARNQLARSIDLPTVNGLGFPKRFIRCLQIAEVLNGMKDLIDFCHANKVGPIEGLNCYFQGDITSTQTEETKETQLFNNQNLPHPNRSIREHCGPATYADHSSVTDSRSLSSSLEMGLARGNLTQQSLGRNLHDDASSRRMVQDSRPINTSNQRQRVTWQFSGPQASYSRQQGNSVLRSSPNTKASESTSNPQQGLVGKLLQEMMAADRARIVHDADKKLKVHRDSKHNLDINLSRGTTSRTQTNDGLSFGHSMPAASGGANLVTPLVKAEIPCSACESNKPATTGTISVKQERNW